MKVKEVLFLNLVFMLALSRDKWSVPLAMEKTDNMEFYISCYFVACVAGDIV